VPCPGGSGGGGVGWDVEVSTLLLSVGAGGGVGLLVCTGVTGVGLETLETFIGRIPLVAPSLTRAAQRFVNPNRKMRTTRADRRDHGEQEAHPLKDRFRAYWSRLREIVIVDSVLVLVQRMSRRR
jgi:hypothetical protein